MRNAKIKPSVKTLTLDPVERTEGGRREGLIKEPDHLGFIFPQSDHILLG